jgi:hypothetical protein
MRRDGGNRLPIPVQVIQPSSPALGRSEPSCAVPLPGLYSKGRLSQEALIASRVERGSVPLPSCLAQASAATLAGPVVDEEASAAVVGSADRVKAVVRAGHTTRRTRRPALLFPRSYESRSRGNSRAPAAPSAACCAAAPGITRGRPPARMGQGVEKVQSRLWAGKTASGVPRRESPAVSSARSP